MSFFVQRSAISHQQHWDAGERTGAVTTDVCDTDRE